VKKLTFWRACQWLTSLLHNFKKTALKHIATSHIVQLGRYHEQLPAMCFMCQK